jgi:hypothetical protein
MRKVINSLSEAGLARLLLIVTVATAAFFLAAYLVVAAGRMAYPYELEWIEGAMVDQVARIAAGQPVYAAPSVDFVPFLYTPLYFYLSAAAAFVLGIGFFPLRLVSILASLGVFALLFATVREETGDSLAAFLAVGLFAACYRIAGAWLDIGRVDSLFLFLLMWFLYLARRMDSLRRAALAGAAGALAYLTKQTAAIFLLPLLAALLLIHPRRAWLTAVTAALLLGLVTYAFQTSSGGWYGYYTFDLLRQQTAWGAVSLQDFLLFDLLGRLPIGLFACAWMLCMEAVHDRARCLFWLAALAGAVAAALLSRLKAGGFENVLLPAYLLIAVFGGLAWARWSERTRTIPALAAAGQIAACLLACVQFSQLLYNPLHQIPSSEEAAQQRAFNQYVADLPGPVYIPYHGNIAHQTGQPTFAHQSAVWDVLRGDPQNAGTIALRQSIAQAVANQKFSTVITDGDWNYLTGLDKYYQRQPDGLPPAVVFHEQVGWPISPTDIFTAKSISK